MNKKEYLLRKRIERKTNTTNKLQAEISRFAEVLNNLPEDNFAAFCQIIAKIKKYKTRIEKHNFEKKLMLNELITRY